MQGRERLICALDVPSIGDAEDLMARLGDAVGFYKIGLELYVAEGSRAVERVRRHGRVFLDLKLHDIPETAARAVAAAAQTGAELLSIHAGGGREMLRRAAEVASARGIKLLAVTVLTSLDDRDLGEIGISGSASEVVCRRAELAIEAGCHGIIASPAELAALRRLLGPRPILLSPGIRPAGAAAGDQKRVATPAQAVRDGADYIVVGRPIRDAGDPAAAARAIVAELDGARA